MSDFLEPEEPLLPIEKPYQELGKSKPFLRVEQAYTDAGFQLSGILGITFTPKNSFHAGVFSHTGRIMLAQSREHTELVFSSFVVGGPDYKFEKPLQELVQHFV